MRIAPLTRAMREKDISMSEDEQELAGAQREHWQRTYGEHPGMYGEEPSEPAVHAAEVFRRRCP